MRVKILLLVLIMNINSFSQITKIRNELSSGHFFYDNIQIENLGNDSVKRIEIFKCEIVGDTTKDSILIKEYKCFRKKIIFNENYLMDSIESIQYGELFHSPYEEYRTKVKFEQLSFSIENKSQYFIPVVNSYKGEIRTINYSIISDTITSLSILLLYHNNLREMKFVYSYNQQNQITKCELFNSKLLIYVYKYKYYY